MIPEHYWEIARRWFWIIIALGVAGAAAGLFLLPLGLGGGKAAYDASMTLAVARFVSFGGTVTAGSEGGGSTTLADYTTSIADKAQTVQFQAHLRAAVKEQGLFATEAALLQEVTVTADRALFRINIRATAASAKDAEILAQEAADVLIEQVVAEETRVKEGLGANTDEQRTELLRRLSDLSDQRVKKLQALDSSALRTALDDLVRDGGAGNDLSEQFRKILEDLALVTGDADLAVIDAQTDVLQSELVTLARAEESFSVDLLEFGKPVFVLDPVETVPTQPESTLRKRDMLLLGTGAGLVMGWLAANMAEQVRTGRGNRREEEEEGED
jgi:hypothetical protein